MDNDRRVGSSGWPADSYSDQDARYVTVPNETSTDSVPIVITSNVRQCLTELTWRWSLSLVVVVMIGQWWASVMSWLVFSGQVSSPETRDFTHCVWSSAGWRHWFDVVCVVCLSVCSVSQRAVSSWTAVHRRRPYVWTSLSLSLRCHFVHGRSIVLSTSVCLSVCVSARISPEPHVQSLRIFLCMGVGAGLYTCTMFCKKKFTFVISSPDEFLCSIVIWLVSGNRCHVWHHIRMCLFFCIVSEIQ